MVRQIAEPVTRHTSRRPDARRTPRPLPQQAQPTLVEGPEEEPWLIDGLKVIETHRQQNLPGVPFYYSKLTLEDGTFRYQCVDCGDVTTTRDTYRAHRASVHPKDSVKVTPAVLSLTLGQIVGMASGSTAIGERIEKVTAERDEARAAHTEVLRQYTALVRALDKVGFMPKVEAAEEEKAAGE